MKVAPRFLGLQESGCLPRSVDPAAGKRRAAGRSCCRRRRPRAPSRRRVTARPRLLQLLAGGRRAGAPRSSMRWSGLGGCEQWAVAVSVAHPKSGGPWHTVRPCDGWFSTRLGPRTGANRPSAIQRLTTPFSDRRPDRVAAAGKFGLISTAACPADSVRLWERAWALPGRARGRPHRRARGAARAGGA